MKTFTVIATFTVDLYSSQEAVDWLEDSLESNFFKDGEKVHSVKAVKQTDTSTKQCSLEHLIANLNSGTMSSHDFAYAVKQLHEKAS